MSILSYNRNLSIPFISEHLLEAASEPLMILTLFLQCDKFEFGDSYKIYSYQTKCEIGFHALP